MVIGHTSQCMLALYTKQTVERDHRQRGAEPKLEHPLSSEEGEAFFFNLWRGGGGLL